MERAGTLINKLKEQFEQQADAGKMAVTAQLLLLELQKNTTRPSVSTNVSVVLPKVSILVNQAVEEKIEEAAPIPDPVTEEPVTNGLYFDIAAAIPTLAHQPYEAVETITEKQVQKESFEYNTALASRSESLNDRLKENKVEVVTTLQGTPIRDLKKAIGINDRFLFVNDLFRGDENMYERSLKTINGFSIYPEAEYWIQRELKVKLGWSDDSESVKLFDQLIRRRFS
jgi:hypothetical protein